MIRNLRTSAISFQLTTCFLLGSLLFINSGCKKTNLQKEVSPEEEVKLPETEIPLEKNFLPLTMEFLHSKYIFKYIDEKPLLTELSLSDGLVLKISYDKALQPQKIEKYKNNKRTQLLEYWTDSKGLVNKTMRFNYDSKGIDYTPAGYYTLSYDDNGRIQALKEYDNSKRILSEQIREYDKGENVSKFSYVSAQNPPHYSTYEYDQRNGIFKHISFIELLSIEFGDYFVAVTTNNPLKHFSSLSLTEEFSYLYNTQKYPIEMISLKNNVKERIKITYKHLN